MSRHNGKTKISASQSNRQLAIESIDHIVGIGKIITDSNRREDKDKAAAQFCLQLHNSLLSIKSWLEDQMNHSKSPRKVEKLLDNLERLCSWTTTRDWDTIRKLGNSKTKVWVTGNIRQLGADKQYAKRRTDIILKLGDFSAKSFSTQADKAPDLSHDSSNQHPPQLSPEFDNDIQRLYEVIREYRFCNQNVSSCEITANFQLNGYEVVNPEKAFADNASSEFGVLFLGHPHKQQSFWIPTRVQICHSKSPAKSAVKFAGEESQTSTALLERSKAEPVHVESFCRYIGKANQGILHLSTRKNKFVYHARDLMSRSWLANRETITLASILQKPKPKPINPRSQAVLAMLLALATWQFYESDMIGDGLTSDSIHFVCEQRNYKPGVFGDEPMLVTRFAKIEGHRNKTNQNEEYEIHTEMLHKIPKILALGILLLEIVEQRTFSEYRQNRNVCPPGPVSIDTDYIIARNLISTQSEDREGSIIHDMILPFRKVIPLCIHSQELIGKVKEKLIAQKIKTPSATVEHAALRSVIYSKIVKPLKDWAEVFPDLKGLKSLFEVEIPEPSLPNTSPLPSLYQHQHAEDNRLREKSQDWFSEYEKFRNIVQSNREPTKNNYERVKIAILDTGISEYEFKNQDDGASMNPPRILHYKDFVSTRETKRDESGHGSAGVILLGVACPNADIYIARVIQSHDVTRDDVARIVQGIDWAIEKGVDIITMAIGFTGPQESVIDAVGRAQTKGILIFAAASNSGNFRSVCCPANMVDKVFGIYSTNADIKPSSFNPTPLCRNTSFAIFGEDIDLKLSENGPLLKGTSYSTSLAAGVAAAVLDFVRQNSDWPGAANLSRLHERPQLTRVFHAMAIPTPECWCIKPWKLLGHFTTYTPEYQRERCLRTLEMIMEPDRLYEHYR